MGPNRITIRAHVISTYTHVRMYARTEVSMNNNPLLDSLMQQFQEAKIQANSWYGNLNLTDMGSKCFEQHIIDSVRTAMITHAFKGNEVAEFSKQLNVKNNIVNAYDELIKKLSDIGFKLVYRCKQDGYDLLNIDSYLFMSSESSAIIVNKNSITLVSCASKENLNKILKIIDIS